MKRFTVGIQTVKEVTPLLNLGVREFFGGLLVRGTWANARPQTSQYNFSSLEELTETCSTIHQGGGEFHLALNEPFDSKEEAKILTLIEKCQIIGVDGFIVSSLPLLKQLQQLEISKRIASCLTTALNKEAISLLDELGAQRIILTRQSSLVEMKIFKQDFPHLEFESFGFFDKCNHLDELCRTTDLIQFKTGKHQKEGCLCLVAGTHHFTTSSDDCLMENSFTAIGEQLRWRSGCAACALPALQYTGIDILKISSRGWSLKRKLAAIEFLKFAISLDDSTIMSPSNRQILRTKFAQDFSEQCTPHHCYHKELGVW